MAVATNLLSMPLVQVEIETGTNEDWVDSMKFVVDDNSGEENIEDWPQLDLTGIAFTMEVRRTTGNREVIISGDTADGTLIVGSAPDYGYLIINIDHEDMLQQQPGKYVADIVGNDELNTRRCVAIDLTIVQGITRP